MKSDVDGFDATGGDGAIRSDGRGDQSDGAPFGRSRSLKSLRPGADTDVLGSHHLEGSECVLAVSPGVLAAPNVGSADMTNMPIALTCRVGVDLAAIGDVEAAVRAHGDRYLQRVFTPHELHCCQTPGGWSMESLAARFSAKEATIKVLQPSAHQPSWKCMEVRRRADHSCAMALSGAAAELAESAGITSLSLSMSHEGSHAAAVVFALCEPRPGASSSQSDALTRRLVEFTSWRGEDGSHD